MNFKYILFLVLISFSPNLYSQSTVKPSDTMIDASYRSGAEENNRYKTEKYNAEFYPTTLLIIDGKKMDVKDNKSNLAVMNSKSQYVEILTEKEMVRKYSEDPLIQRLFLVTTNRK